MKHIAIVFDAEDTIEAAKILYNLADYIKASKRNSGTVGNADGDIVGTFTISN